MTEIMTRPKDNTGAEIVFGDWYWAMSLDNHIRGAGFFRAIDGYSNVVFVLDGVELSLCNFKEFAPAGDPWRKFISATTTLTANSCRQQPF